MTYLPLAREFDGTGFADDGDFDLAGILEVLLDLEGDLAGKVVRFHVPKLLGFDEDADLAACLESVGLLDALEAVCDRFKISKALEVILDVVAACARTGTGDGVSGLNNA